MPKPTITIGGVDVTALIEHIYYEDDIGAIDKAEMWAHRSINDAVTIVNGLAVVVRFDATTIFTGYIANFERQVNFVIKCDSQAGILSRKRVDESYVAQRPDQILADLIGTYTSFTTTNIDVTPITLSTYKADGTLFEIVEEMASLMDWQWFVDPTGTDFYFQPKGDAVYPTILKTSGTGANCSKIGKWTFDTARMVNYITIEGDRRAIQTYETFSGDSSTVTFTLLYKPIGNVRVLVGGVEQKGGVHKITAAPDYVVNKDEKKITFYAGSTPGTGTDNIEVYYEYGIPTKITAQNDASIALYGHYENKAVNAALQTVNDVKEYAKKYLAKFSEPFERGSLETKLIDTGMKAGYTCTVIDETPGINDTFVIQKVAIEWGKGVGHKTKLTVGTEDYKLYDWTKYLNQRLRELEKTNRNEEDITVYLRNVDDTLGVGGYLAVKTHSINDSWIWGHPTNAVYGTSKWGDRRSAYTTNYRSYQHVEVIDKTYENTGETTADWDIAGKITAAAHV